MEVVPVDPENFENIDNHLDESLDCPTIDQQLKEVEMDRENAEKAERLRQEEEMAQRIARQEVRAYILPTAGLPTAVSVCLSVCLSV